MAAEIYTYNFTSNYGAILQTFCLGVYINSITNSEVKWLQVQKPTTRGYFFKFIAWILLFKKVSAQGWFPIFKNSFNLFPHMAHLLIFFIILILKNNSLIQYIKLFFQKEQY